MHDVFIYRLATCFTGSIILWALLSYVEIWIDHNMRKTARLLAGLLHAETRANIQDAPGYCIIQGLYKNRKIVCRMSAFSPSSFLHYNLRLHIHIEPLTRAFARQGEGRRITENTYRSSDNSINYDCTSSTTIKSYLFSSLVDRDTFLQVFEELTKAAEIVETNE